MNSAERLKFIRNKVNLSQKKFAEFLGVKTQNIEYVESKNPKYIPAELAELLQEKLLYNFEWIVKGTGSPFITGQAESEKDEISTVKVNLKKGQRLIVNYED